MCPSPSPTASALLPPASTRAAAVLAATTALAALPARAAPAPAVQARPDPARAVPIGRLHEDRDGDGVPDLLGDTVTVAGRAAVGTGVLHPERLDVPIQHGDRGVYLFDWSAAEPVEAGDSVIARGVVGSYRGRLQIKAPRYRVVPASPRRPEPEEVEIQSRALERREGTLAEVEGRLVRSTRNEGGRMLVLQGFAEPDQVVTVFVPWERTASFDLDGFAEGDRLRVRGVVGQYDSEPPDDAMYQIYPVGSEGVRAVGLTADLYRKLALGVGAALVAGFLIWGVMLMREVRKRKEAQERYESLFDENVAGVAALDAAGEIDRFNDAFRDLLEISGDPGDGLSLAEVVPEGAREEVRRHVDAALAGRASHFESELSPRGARRIHVEVSTVPIVVDGRTDGVYLIVEDITHRKELEERLQHQALHDYLTGLPNRALFTDRLEHAVERTERSGGRLAVLFFDIDGFKEINDSAGHAAGDRLLNTVADRMRDVARDADTLARFGGDEFALLLEDLEGRGEAMRVAGRIQEALEEPVPVGGSTARVSASVGVAVCEAGEEPPRELLQRADRAMYRAKAEGGARSRLDDGGDRDGPDEAGRLDRELRDAVEGDQLFLEYQPVVCLETGRMIGAEALVRWDHPDRGRLEPASFVPRAERSGLIVEVDRWVLRRARVEMGAWQRRHPEHAPMLLSVNLSERHFDEPGFVGAIGAVLEDTGAHEGEVQLEIGEGAAARRPEEARRLASLGVRLAVDDFGTGRSSLDYLRVLPVDALKLDRSFVAEAASDPAASAIARTAVTLGRSLDARVVAEGVETDGQLQEVADVGFGLAQGFLLGEPLRIQELDPRPPRGRVERAGA